MPLVTVLEFETFVKDADRLLGEEELDDLRNILAVNPDAGEIMTGTGGVRKLRHGLQRKGKGKRGGARIIYYYYNETMPLALIALYAKGEKIDLSAGEKRELKALTKVYVEGFSKKSKKGTS